MSKVAKEILRRDDLFVEWMDARGWEYEVGSLRWCVWPLRLLARQFAVLLLWLYSLKLRVRLYFKERALARNVAKMRAIEAEAYAEFGVDITKPPYSDNTVDPNECSELDRTQE